MTTDDAHVWGAGAFVWRGVHIGTGARLPRRTLADIYTTKGT